MRGHLGLGCRFDGGRFFGRRVRRRLGGFGYSGFRGRAFDSFRLRDLLAGRRVGRQSGCLGRRHRIGAFQRLRCFGRRAATALAAFGLGSHGLEQGFGLGDQFHAQLVGAPTLPAFHLAGGRQRGMRARFQLVVDQLAVLLQSIAQRRSHAGGGLAVALRDFLFELAERVGDGLDGLGAHFRIDRSLRRARRLLRRGFGRQAAGLAQFVGPHGHRRQRRRGVLRSRDGLRQRGLERLPHHLQLVARGFQQRREARIHAGPVRIVEQRLRLLLPLRDVGAQRFDGRLRVAPRLGGKHLDALRQQHRRFALHLHARLQVFDALDAVGQLHLHAGERLAAQGRARLGRIALPGHRVGDVQPGLRQQAARLLGPFGGDDFWPLARLISSSFSRSGRAAPLSRALSSRKTSCICSVPGWVAIHSRTRAVRSPRWARRRRRRSGHRATGCLGVWESSLAGNSCVGKENPQGGGKPILSPRLRRAGDDGRGRHFPPPKKARQRA
ncbi:hypothetical protein HK414_10885 [Ramlibacter terrae]|uniref:Uncharacterized protein n=1 Tax=Ramlibacter terrae TaxID=2732511 RepID=A0ABX6P2A2_9BURK|nr:hypothetical protein HK414_10885 [Ramlibacter terrae]